MTDVIIWGRVEQFAPASFLAIGTCIPASPVLAGRAEVLTEVSNSLDDAQKALAEIVIALGVDARSRGDRVVDVETA